MVIATERETHLSAARALLAGGRVGDAEVLARGVLISDRGDPDALDLLARIQLLHDRPAEALDLIDRALLRAPNTMILHAHRAVALQALGEPERAIAAADEALRVGGLVQAVTWNARGLALLDLGRAEEAAQNFRDAIVHQPDHRAARNNLGQALLALGRPAEAETELRRAIDGGASKPDLWISLGRALSGQGRVGESAEMIGHALRAAPDHPIAWRSLGNVRALTGRPEEAIQCYAKALAIHPDPSTESNQLHCRLYLESESRASIREAHRAYGVRHCGGPSGSSRKVLGPSTEGRPLRIGFLSPDFARHPVGYLSLRVIEAFSPDRVQTFLYSDTPLEDPLTDRFRAAATRFSDVRGLDDGRLRSEIRGDRLDVLIDLAGHTAGNRLPLFSERVAPIQASWIGYPSTTGVPGMDLFLTDELLVPPGTEDEFTERVCRLAASAVTFDPPEEAPPVLPRRPGPIRFGAFHNPAKLTFAAIDRYASVLCAIPTAELRFKYTGLDVPETSDRLAKQMAARGVGRARLTFDGFSPLEDALAQFADTDIALDPTPFSGGLTSMTALWMGVPVLTVAGETLASRQSSAYLARIGHEGWIGRDEQELVEIAADLASRPDLLAKSRAELRDRLTASCLMDGQKTALALEQALRAALRS